MGARKLDLNPEARPHRTREHSSGNVRAGRREIGEQAACSVSRSVCERVTICRELLMRISTLCSRLRSNPAARRSCRRILCGLIACVLVEYAGIQVLRSVGIVARYVPVPEFRSVHPVCPELNSEFDRQTRRVLRGASPLALMQRVMDEVGCVESTPATDVRGLLEHVRADGGLTCGGMATVLNYTCRLNGLRSRTIQLQRHLGDRYETHVVVEVWHNDRWTVFDPTFNVTYARDGRDLGADELAAAVYNGQIAEVRPVFHGAVRYPARIEDYYTDWRPLFNNVFIPDWSRRTHRLARFPPFRYWHGPVVYYRNDVGSTRHIDAANNALFVFLVIVPAFAGLLSVLFAWRVLQAVLRPALCRQETSREAVPRQRAA